MSRGLHLPELTFACEKGEEMQHPKWRMSKVLKALGLRPFTQRRLWWILKLWTWGLSPPDSTTLPPTKITLRPNRKYLKMPSSFKPLRDGPMSIYNLDYIAIMTLQLPSRLNSILLSGASTTLHCWHSRLWDQDLEIVERGSLKVKSCKSWNKKDIKRISNGMSMDYVSTPFFHLVSSLLLTFLRAAARRFAAISSAQRLQCPSMVLYSIRHLRHLRHLDHYPKAKPNRAKKSWFLIDFGSKSFRNTNEYKHAMKVKTWKA